MLSLVHPSLSCICLKVTDRSAERDDADAIDKSNIIDDRTRGAVKDYTEPGDEEGLGGPEDGRSRVAGGPN